MSCKKLVFIFRLSAIGDIVIASRTVQYFLKNDYIPIFVSSIQFKDILLKVKKLDYCIFLDKTLPTQYYMRSAKVSRADVVSALTLYLSSKNVIFCDLQNRPRSFRARRYVKKYILGFNPDKTYKLKLNIIYRSYLIFRAWCNFRQKKLNTDSNKNIKRIHDIQLNLINNIFRIEKKPTFSEHLLTNYLSQESSVNGKYICIFQGASGDLKKWPIENFIELVKLLLINTIYDIYVCGGKEDLQSAKNFTELSSRVHVRIGIDSLNTSFNLIANSQHVFCNDSFASHVADAYQVPATVIFGPTSPKFGFIPLSKKIHVKYQNFNCSPCTRHGKGKCRFGNSLCLASIKPIDIFQDFLSKSL